MWVPDEESEALRDLVRAREAAKQDQLRARHRLTKFLLRTGQRPPLGVKAWTERYVRWVQQVRYTHPAQEATLLDCLNEVRAHGRTSQAAGAGRLWKWFKLAPASMQEVIRGLQALRGIAHISAVTIAVELGNITSRFQSARDLMGYCGAVSERRLQRQAYSTEEALPSPATRTSDESWSNQPGAIATGRHRSKVAQATGRASGRDHRNCLESAEPPAQAIYEADGARQGPEEDHDGGRTRTAGLHLGHRDQGRSGRASNKWRHDENRKNKSKNFPKKEKAKTNQPMNNAIQLEDRVSRSRSKHEGESSAEVCDRLSRTRVSSQRQLPTDHDYAVPTREYQLDQSSPLPATAAADSCPRSTKTKTTPAIRRY